MVACDGKRSNTSTPWSAVEYTGKLTLLGMQWYGVFDRAHSGQAMTFLFLISRKEGRQEVARLRFDIWKPKHELQYGGAMNSLLSKYHTRSVEETFTLLQCRGLGL